MLDVSNSPHWQIPYTNLDLDTVFDYLTNCMYDIYVFMQRTSITVAGYTFSLWNMLIGAMVIAFITAACIPETPGSPEIDEFFENDIYIHEDDY